MLYPQLKGLCESSASICIASDSLCNNYGIVCHYISDFLSQTSEKILFISYRETLETYTGDLKRTGVDWSKMDFHFASVPELPSNSTLYDVLIIDGASLIGLEVVELFVLFIGKKVLITIDSGDKYLFEFIARRCQSYLICNSLETGLSKHFDGTLKFHHTGKANPVSSFLYKFGDTSLQLTVKQ
jgi:hypothetical protein